MGNNIFGGIEDPFAKILKEAISTQRPPDPARRDLDLIWDVVDLDQNDLLDDDEIVSLIEHYLKVQEEVLKKFRKPKRKQMRKKLLTPGLDLADLILKHEKLRSRRQLYTILEKDPQKVVSYVKHLFGLTPAQKLTSAIFSSQGGKVLFQPWNLPKKLVMKTDNTSTFAWNPYDFDDSKIQDAFRSSHYFNVWDRQTGEANLRLIRETLRKLGKIENLGLPTQVEDPFKKKKNQTEEERMQQLSKSPLKGKLKNNSPYKNGTIVEVYSASSIRWVLGEVIGAKSDHAINVRYLDQCKFLNPNDESRFRLIEKIVSTPYGIGFIQHVRHEDHFCLVNLDWGVVTVKGNLIGTMKVQKPPKLAGEMETVVRGNLLIKVVKALELPKADIGDSCDPYVEMVIDDGYGETILQRTMTQRRTQHPRFNQVLDFKAFELMVEREERRGVVRVYDSENNKEDTFIGEAEFKLPTRNDTVEDYFLDLRRFDNVTGVIVLQTTLIRNELSASERQRKREHFTTRMGEVIRRRKKKA